MDPPKKSFFSGLNTLKLKKKILSEFPLNALKLEKKSYFRGEIARVLNALNREKKSYCRISTQKFRPENFDPKIAEIFDSKIATSRFKSLKTVLFGDLFFFFGRRLGRRPKKQAGRQPAHRSACLLKPQKKLIFGSKLVASWLTNRPTYFRPTDSDQPMLPLIMLPALAGGVRQEYDIKLSWYQ